MPFSLEYLRKETHLVLPRYSPYIITEQIYDLLFQYVLTPEREILLKNFIQKLEAYIKSRPEAPFSISLEALSFLGEGWQELKFLNWAEIPVSVFAAHFPENLSEEEKEKQIAEIHHLILVNYEPETQIFYAYPRGMVW